MRMLENDLGHAFGSRFQSAKNGVRQAAERLEILTMRVAELTHSPWGRTFDHGTHGESCRFMNLAGQAIQAARTKALALEAPAIPVAPRQDDDCSSG